MGHQVRHCPENGMMMCTVLFRTVNAGKFLSEWTTRQKRAVELLQYIPHVIPHRKVTIAHRFDCDLCCMITESGGVLPTYS